MTADYATNVIHYDLYLGYKTDWPPGHKLSLRHASMPEAIASSSAAQQLW